MMRNKTVVAGLIAVAVMFSAAPASAGGLSVQFGSGGAQFEAFDGGYRWNQGRQARNQILSPQQVRRVLRQQGFRNINSVDRRGSIYQVKATTSGGERVGLVVNARNGDILNSYRP